MITLRGREAHSAFPAEGRSAIYDAARVLLLLEQLAEELKSQQDSAFDPPYTTLNVGVIEGGTAKNIVPGECRITVEWRPVPGEDRNRVPDLLRGVLARAAEATPEMQPSLEIRRIDPAFAPSDTQQIADILSEMTGNEPATIAFGSEAAHFRELTGEAVVFGPGDMTVAHKSGEFVPVADLDRCTTCLRTAVRRVCEAG
jgi:acetylornithine deacetylase